jgi:hypothetical protein
MRLDLKRESEIQQRKGLAKRTVVASAWLVASLVVGFFLTGWLLNSGAIDTAFFYDELSIPETVSLQIIRLILILLVVIVMQFFLIIGFALVSPEARKKTGLPTAEAQSVDPFAAKYDYHG